MLGVAPAAKQMGTHVARSLRARLAGGSAQPFVYADYGNLATIGRMAEVVDLRGFQFSGLLAWWFWLGAHVYFLVGFRNRVSVLLNRALAYYYWTYRRGARIVLGQDRAAESRPCPQTPPCSCNAPCAAPCTTGKSRAACC